MKITIIIEQPGQTPVVVTVEPQQSEAPLAIEPAARFADECLDDHAWFEEGWYDEGWEPCFTDRD